MEMELLSKTFFGNSLINYVLALGIILATVVIGKILQLFLNTLFKKIVKKSKNKFDDIIVKEVDKAIFNIFIILGIYFASFALVLAENIMGYYMNFIKILFIFILTKSLLSLWDSIAKELIHPIVKKSESDLDDIILPVLSKTIKTLIIAMALIMVLSDLGFNVMSFVAGIGIGGLALALASKDFVANIFGAFSVYSDKMFRLGDTIKVKGEEGKVIEIGLRSTKIKREDGSIVILPNSLMTSNPVVNKGKMKTEKNSK